MNFSAEWLENVSSGILWEAKEGFVEVSDRAFALVLDYFLH